MYRVTICNGDTATIIHEPSVAIDEPHLYTGSLVQGSSGEIDTVSFDVLPNNPGYDLLASRTTMVTVDNTATGEREFSGRVLTITPQMDSSGLIYKSVTCEDRLGFLCDSIQPYTAEATYALEDFFKLLLENHNSQVEDYKKIYPGTISAMASASTGNVTKGLNYESTWEALTTKLLNTEGGEIQLHEGEDGLLYLDYVAELGSVSETTIELGKNMTSISREIDPTDIITRLIPLGANLEADDDDGDVDTNAKTTIASVNDGCLWIDDEEAQAAYGIVVGTVEWEDVTEPSNLLTKAKAWMEAQTLTDKVTLSALDLSIIGLESEAIERYNYYPVVNAAIGLNDYLRVVKRTVNLCDPSDITYEMGEHTTAITTSINAAAQQAKTATSNTASAKATANGKNAAYYATTAPSPSKYDLSKHDLWFDTSDGYAMHYWSGTTWVAAPLGAGALGENCVTAEKITDGAVTTKKINVEQLSDVASEVGNVTTGGNAIKHIIDVQTVSVATSEAVEDQTVATATGTFEALDGAAYLLIPQDFDNGVCMGVLHNGTAATARVLNTSGAANTITGSMIAVGYI